MKHLKKLLFSSVFVGILLSNIYATYAEEEYETDTITTISEFEVAEPNSITPLVSSLNISGTNSYSTTAQLTKKEKYGKVFFSNNGSQSVTVTISYNGTTVSTGSIPAYSGGSLYFTNTGTFSKTYDIDIHCSSANINGILSIARSSAAWT